MSRAKRGGRKGRTKIREGCYELRLKKPFWYGAGIFNTAGGIILILQEDKIMGLAILIIGIFMIITESKYKIIQKEEE